MLKVYTLTFGPFQLNTYILADETKQCVIIDPGCYDEDENNRLDKFIESHDLKPQKLLQTHCHLDHVFGSKHVAKKYNLLMEAAKEAQFILDRFETSCEIYGISKELPPPIGNFISEGDKIKFGNSEIEVLFVPGHTPGHLVFYCNKSRIVIVGDVLFKGSIGRTDLPGGNFEQLVLNIKNKVYQLPNDFTVYSGHGDTTTIGVEKMSNPFVRA